MSVNGRIRTWVNCGAWAVGLAPLVSWGGGSGLNTVVVVNQTSSNSLAVGNFFCERRQVPPQNVLRVNWTGGNVSWTLAQCQSVLATPLQAMLAARGLAGQIDCVALSLDIPYRVTAGSSVNSTTSVLFYGFKTNTAAPGPGLPASCSLPPDSANAYMGREMPFRLTPPGTNTNSFLAIMLTAYTPDEALLLVDQGVRSDGSCPTQTVLLEKTTDTARNVRYLAFDNAIFDARASGRLALVRTNSNQLPGLTNLLGLDTGVATFTMSTNSFVPGAIADTLTSTSGFLFENSGQTPVLGFLRAGAVGSYGAVVEPCNYLEKFPDPLDYFYQARGFSLVEAYYLSLRNPYQGIMVGEPLAAPFAQPGRGAWPGLPDDALLTGTTNLSLAFSAVDTARPLQQVDLFIDGTFAATLTNVAPAPGNVLAVTLNGTALSYTVPANATLTSVTAGLMGQINSASNTTSVLGWAFGDRMELDSFAAATLGPQVTITTGQVAGSADALTTFVAASRTNFLDSIARGYRSFAVTGTSGSGDYLQATITKTNGEMVMLGVTNGPTPVNTVQLAQQLLALLNATTALRETNGVSAEDTYPSGTNNIQFLLYARTAGWSAAQMQITLQASTNLTLAPTGACQFDENLSDLRPRNHLYVTAGATNLSFDFPLSTATLADGDHELTAVAYEGSHVRTQTRTTRRVHIRNTTLSARLDVAGINNTLQFTVTASTSTIARIELFGTGGSWGVVSNQSVASFSLAATNLGTGLHSFYALVTDPAGHQYRVAGGAIRVSDALQFACPANLTTNTTAADQVVAFVASFGGNPAVTNVACVPPSGSSFPVGVTSVACTVQDNHGASAQCGFTVTVQQTVLCQLAWPNFAGHTPRSVTFKATDQAGSVRQEWNTPLDFSGGLASATLTVPLGTIQLSAKTSWTLRRRVAVAFNAGQAQANFTGTNALVAGDLDNSNSVDWPDYFALAAAWYTANDACDLDGSGLVDILDYFTLASGWLRPGDPE